jgi:alpha-1,2-mannosyltransferase
MTYASAAAWVRPRLWIGIVVGLVPWAVWIGSLAMGGWYKDAEGTLIGADHLAFYTAAHLISDGRQAEMYDYRDLTEYQRNLIGWDWRGFEAFRNPPFYALLYLPTAGLSYYVSLLIWTAIGFGVLAFSIWLLAPQRPGQVMLWSLVFYPVFATISFGQNTLLSLAIFSGIYRLLKNDRLFHAGLIGGLLWFKPQLLLGFFIWWAFSPRKYIRCWLGVLVTGLALAAVSWGLLPEASQAFVDKIKTIVGFSGFRLWNVHNPKAFFELLLPDDPPLSNEFLLVGREMTVKSALIWVLTLAISGLSVLTAWRISRRTKSSLATMFPVAVFLSLWASPHALIYEWTLLIAAATVLWEQYSERRDCWVCMFAMAWVVLTVSTTFTVVQTLYLKLACALQVSVPILGLAGWLTARELSNARTAAEQK